MLNLRQKNNESGKERDIAVTITGITDTTITIDANHPLAGKDLTFEIKLVEIK